MTGFFLTDAAVARALAPDADWQEAEVADHLPTSSGALTAADGVCRGVLAEPTEDAALRAYLQSLPGTLGPVAVAPVAGPGAGQARTALAVCGDGAVGFGADDRQIEARIAADVARICAGPTEHNLPIARAGLLMRARSHHRAAEGASPVALRHPFAQTDVVAPQREMPYARYFDVEEITLRHRRFDGTMSSPVVRTVLRSADAVTVLPYDPVRDEVVLVEQFRPGAFGRGDPHPWVLEPVAGRCDGNEPVEEVARREMIEEAGLQLIRLEAIGGYYPSPGCLTEYLHSFVGLVDLSAAAAGVHGLDAEGEDIRTHILPFEAAFNLIRSGEAENGPLLLSLYWLAANRARLQQGAGTA